MIWPSLTIAICTYNRPAELAKCLSSIVECARSENLLPRVLVVDNYGDIREDLIHDYHALDLKIVKEEKTGLAFARNRVIEEVKDEWVFFLDDDAWFDPGRNSIRIIAELFSAKVDADVIAAHVEGHFEVGSSGWLKAEYYHPEPFSEEFSDLGNGWLQGGAAIYRTKWLRMLGGFETGLGMTGSTIAYGEDTQLEKRLREKGARIKFHPEIIVLHRIQYRSVRAVLSSFYRRTLTFYYIYEERAIHHTFRSVVSQLLASVRAFFKAFIKMGRRYGLRNAYIDIAQPLIRAYVICKVGGPQYFRKLRVEYRRNDRAFALLLNSYCKRNKDIHFIQLGGCDGISFDPVRSYIDRYHWKGVIVEPLEHLVQKLKAIYPEGSGVAIESSAIASEDGEVEIFFPKDQGRDLPDWAIGVASLRPDRTVLNPVLDANGVVSSEILSAKVPALTWNSLLHNHELPKIDILVMDIEGMEYEVLKQIDPLPDIVIMEYSNLPTNEISYIRTKFGNAGFVIIRYNSTDLIAIRRQSLTLRDKLRLNLPL